MLSGWKFSETGDVINIRFLLSEAIFFNSCTPTKFTRISKEISNFLWNTNPKKDENC